jgi:hypothetical protein
MERILGKVRELIADNAYRATSEEADIPLDMIVGSRW